MIVYLDSSVILRYALNFLNITKARLKEAAQNWGLTVGSLDAIHLASALLSKKMIQSDLLFLTHDKTLATAARTQGLTVKGVP